MREPDRTSTTVRGGSAEALLLAGALAVTLLSAHAVWTGMGLYWPGRRTSTDHPAATWLFLSVVFGVLALDGIAAVSLWLRLTGSSRAPASRWIFGPGLLSAIVATVAAALVLRSHIGEFGRSLHVPGTGPNATAALLLLAFGVLGLLVASLGLLSGRGDEVVRGERYGSAALFQLCGAAILLASLDIRWMVYISRLAGYPPNTLLRAASAWFVVLAAMATPLAALAVWSGRGTPAAGSRPLFRRPIGALLLLVLTGLAVWCVGDLPTGRPGSQGFEFSIEFLKKLLTGTGDETGLSPIWVLCRGLATILILLIEGAYWVTRRKTPDPRLAVTLTWIGSAAAGLAILIAAGGLKGAAEVVLRHGENVTLKDLMDCMIADGGVAFLIPIFLVAHLMAAARPFKAGRAHHLMRRLGLTGVILGTAGLVVLSGFWMAELELYGKSPASFKWLRTGALLLWWGAVAFLICATAGWMLELARQSRLRTSETADPAVEAGEW